MEKTMTKPDWLVSTTFLRHFIFDGAVLLIIKLKFFSGNIDFFKQDSPYWLLHTKKGKKMLEKFHLKQQTNNWAFGSSVQTFHNLNCIGNGIT